LLDGQARNHLTHKTCDCGKRDRQDHRISGWSACITTLTYYTKPCQPAVYHPPAHSLRSEAYRQPPSLRAALLVLLTTSPYSRHHPYTQPASL